MNHSFIKPVTCIENKNRVHFDFMVIENTAHSLPSVPLKVCRWHRWYLVGRCSNVEGIDGTCVF